MILNNIDDSSHSLINFKQCEAETILRFIWTYLTLDEKQKSKMKQLRNQMEDKKTQDIKNTYANSKIKNDISENKNNKKTNKWFSVFSNAKTKLNSIKTQTCKQIVRLYKQVKNKFNGANYKYPDLRNITNEDGEIYFKVNWKDPYANKSYNLEQNNGKVGEYINKILDQDGNWQLAQLIGISQLTNIKKALYIIGLLCNLENKNGKNVARPNFSFNSAVNMNNFLHNKIQYSSDSNFKDAVETLTRLNIDREEFELICSLVGMESKRENCFESNDKLNIVCLLDNVSIDDRIHNFSGIQNLSQEDLNDCIKKEINRKPSEEQLSEEQIKKTLEHGIVQIKALAIQANIDINNAQAEDKLNNIYTEKYNKTKESNTIEKDKEKNTDSKENVNNTTETSNEGENNGNQKRNNITGYQEHQNINRKQNTDLTAKDIINYEKKVNAEKEEPAELIDIEHNKTLQSNNINNNNNKESGQTNHEKIVIDNNDNNDIRFENNVYVNLKRNQDDENQNKCKQLNIDKEKEYDGNNQKLNGSQSEFDDKNSEETQEKNDNNKVQNQVNQENINDNPISENKINKISPKQKEKVVYEDVDIKKYNEEKDNDNKVKSTNDEGTENKITKNDGKERDCVMEQNMNSNETTWSKFKNLGIMLIIIGICWPVLKFLIFKQLSLMFAVIPAPLLIVIGLALVIVSYANNDPRKNLKIGGKCNDTCINEKLIKQVHSKPREIENNKTSHEY